MLVNTVPGRWLPVVVLILAAGLFLGRLGERALWSEELRWAEIPREMVLTGDYFHPTINGRSYYDKPLGSYWLVLASAGLTGSLDETAARLPCALAGLLGIVLVMVLAGRLFDRATATLAGLILATSFAYIFFARNASADMENLVGILAALVLWLVGGDNPLGVVASWLVMAVTSLTKGLLGFALPLLLIGLLACLKDGWRPFAAGALAGSLRDRADWLVRRNAWLFNRWTLLAAPLAVIVYLLPFALSGSEGTGRGLDLVYRENLQRFFNPHNHRGPIYLYAYVIFGLLAPWSCFLPAALVQAHARARAREEGRGDRFALICFWGTLAFFTLAASRRSYYLLPILPFAGLLLARLFAARREAIAPLAWRLLQGGTVALALALVGLGVCLVLPTGAWLDVPAPPLPWLLGGIAVVCVVAAGLALARLTPARAGLATALAAVCVMGYFYLVALPAAEPYRDGKDFARRVLEELGPEPEGLALYRTESPVFYLGQPRPLAAFDEADPLVEAIAAGDVHWVIARRRDLDTLPAATVVQAEASFAWEGAHRDTHLLLVRVGPER
jgi:4-amino-4-deoxy-L-arabinose transferase-like glycosyltransferase